MRRHLYRYWNKFKQFFFQFFIRVIVLPTIDKVCPIVDLRVKYSTICCNNDVLTVESWDRYVEYLRTIKIQTKTQINGRQEREEFEEKVDEEVDKEEGYEPGTELDYFDQLILSKIAKINRKIKLRISESEYAGSSRAIGFHAFYEILNVELGNAIRFKYRYTYDSFLFASLLEDDGPYRRFRWCDRI